MEQQQVTELRRRVLKLPGTYLCCPEQLSTKPLAIYRQLSPLCFSTAGVLSCVLRSLLIYVLLYPNCDDEISNSFILLST